MPIGFGQKAKSVLRELIDRMWRMGQQYGMQISRSESIVPNNGYFHVTIG